MTEGVRQGFFFGGGGGCSKARTRLRKQTEQKAPTSRSKKTTALFNGAERKKRERGGEGREGDVRRSSL